ncbi:MAG: YabP/YqfC family sporulation protein [Clostridiales bacterium]|nr:YabP/YqfC family sporulation protein [Clostridiales bacterium]
MNNSFSQCVADICGLELATLVKDYKYSVFGGHTVVVEGHKGIVVYSTTQVSFAVGKSTLQICGDNLNIKCLEKHFAVVVGKVLSVEVKDAK